MNTTVPSALFSLLILTVLMLSSARMPTPALAQTPAPLPELKSVRLTAANVAGGAPVVGIVTLTGRAPAGGVAVRLRSSDPALAPLPASITVPEGRKSAPFTLLTRPAAAETRITLTAICGELKTATLTLRPLGIAEVILTPDSVTGGENIIGVLRLDVPAGKDSEVTLTSDDSAITVQPATLSIKKGETRAQFEALTKTVKHKTSAKITAKINGAAATATLTITP